MGGCEADLGHSEILEVSDCSRALSVDDQAGSSTGTIPLMSTMPFKLMIGAVRLIVAPAVTLITVSAVLLMTGASTLITAGVRVTVVMPTVCVMVSIAVVVWLPSGSEIF